MVVYADILIVLNLIVNYFLLLATSKLLRRNVKVLPMLLSALAGAFSSLYIFLPKPSVIAELFFNVGNRLWFKGNKTIFKGISLAFCCYLRLCRNYDGGVAYIQPQGNGYKQFGGLF